MSDDNQKQLQTRRQFLGQAAVCMGGITTVCAINALAARVNEGHHETILRPDAADFEKRHAAQAIEKNHTAAILTSMGAAVASAAGAAAVERVPPTQTEHPQDDRPVHSRPETLRENGHSTPVISDRLRSRR